MPTPAYLLETASRLRALAAAIQTTEGYDAIDWTAIKKIIASLLTTVGPILLDLLITWLSQNTTPPDQLPAA